MSIRCLIGHDYGDPETERDREERGDEVVVTVREFRECSRCGNRQMISENKEVRSVETGAGDEATADGTDDEEEERRGEYDDVSAEEDDGVILEDGDDGEAEGRQRGEWPEEPSEEESSDEEPREWPEVEGDDEGYAAGPAEGGAASDVEFGGGLTPESRPAPPGEDAGDEETVEGTETEEFTRGSGIRSATPGPTPTQQQRSNDGDTDLVCPECDHTAPTEGTSLRPGDICPECRRGYLAERTRE